MVNIPIGPPPAMPPAVKTKPLAVKVMLPKAKQAPTKDIGSRWTPRLAEGGWTAITVSFLDTYGKLDITSGEAMFIIHLMRYKWDDKMPFPGFPTIADKMGVTDISVRKYARDLEKRKLIRRVQRSGRTTVFDLSPLFAALEQKLNDVQKTNDENKEEKS